MENDKERERIVISNTLADDDNDQNIFTVMSHLFAETPHPDEIRLHDQKPSP